LENLVFRNNQEKLNLPLCSAAGTSLSLPASVFFIFGLLVCYSIALHGPVAAMVTCRRASA
jgi:hypothetical protein